MDVVSVLLAEKIGVALGAEALKALGSILAKDSSTLTEINGSLDRIKREFIVMKAFIIQVDAQEDKSGTVKAWLEQIRKVAFDVEDVIDEYTYLLGGQSRSGFRGSLHYTLHRAKNLVSWQQIAAQLKQIEAGLQQVSEMRVRYDIKTSEVSNYACGRELYRADSSYSFDDDGVVGIGEERETLVKWLLDGKPSRLIISIWGMGGLGKTTLVSCVYKSQVIRQHFECHAWISVSQNYKTEDLLRKLLLDFLGERQAKSQEIDSMPRRTLVETLHSYLHGKKYLIILDDVWSEDAWLGIDGAITDSNCGGRIVITTRIKDVALLASRDHVLELQSLKQREAWQLFCMKAFWNEEGRKCPPGLEPLAQKIVESCQGLPLAIVAIGSLLSRRAMDELEWRKIYDHLSWELTANTYLPVRNTLNLSFIYLPDYLKNCFMHCCIFPEDYLIKRKRLIRLWVAEGFIEETGANTAEEVAEEYLNELIHRCMLQVVDRNDLGRVRSCRMHDLVRELNISTSRSKKFCTPYDGIVAASCGDEARRLSIHRSGNELQSMIRLPNLRSFFLFDSVLSPSLLRPMIAQFRLLRVLDLQDVPIETVPDEVFALFNLHYLGLRNTKVKELPKSLGRLRNLQTLDLASTDVEELPHGITKLMKLRNLVVDRINDPTFEDFHDVSGMIAPKGLWELQGLRVLQTVEANAELVRQIGNLKQLRALKMTKVQHTDCAELFASISKMRFLVKLGIVACNGSEKLDLEALNPSPPLLEKLGLKGKLSKGVKSTLFLGLGNNLRRLYLGWSGLAVDPFPSLSHMSTLVSLCLDRAYEGEKLQVQAGWFPKLKVLSLAYMAQLKWFDLQYGAIQNLVKLELICLESMEACPRGIETLKSLQEMNLLEMPNAFIYGIKGWRIHQFLKHIPNVTHIYKMPSMQEVPLETVEENENAAFSADAILFEYSDGDWKERGKGEIKVNISTSGSEKARLIMRANGNYRLILNASLFPDMKLKKLDEKADVIFACANSAGEGKGGLATFVLSFKDSSQVEEFCETVHLHAKGKRIPY